MSETPFTTSANSAERRQLIASVADIVLARVEPIVRVAVDGVSGAGKTLFANEVAAQLQRAGRNVIRASVDDFHRPKAQRYRLGRDSPDGHYLESYDYEALELELLDPMKPGGSRLYRTAIFDCMLDSPIESDQLCACDGTILVVQRLVSQSRRTASILGRIDLSRGFVRNRDRPLRGARRIGTRSRRHL